jgi:enolase
VILLDSTRISSIKTRICYDSRGDKTIEADIKVGESIGRACAPRGASAGKFEAPNFSPDGVEQSLIFFKKYSNKLLEQDASDIKLFSKTLEEIDGTDNFNQIGGAMAYALSIAAAEAAAKSKRIPMYKLLSLDGDPTIPYPIGNVLGGGKHAGPGSPNIQEFLVCPVGAHNIRDAIRTNNQVHREVGRQIVKRDPFFSGGKGDEGAWAPKMGDEEALEIVDFSAKKVSDELGIKVRVGLDVAASSIWDEKKKAYIYSKSNVIRTPIEQMDFMVELTQKYDLMYLEDPLHEEAFDEFAEVSKILKHTYVVGDDLFVTNSSRLLKGVETKAANAVILKVNQAGSLGRALDFAEKALINNISITSSHRSGDTPDSHLSHIAVGTKSKMIKSGVVGGERIAKLNELLRIEEGSERIKMVKIEV